MGDAPARIDRIEVLLLRVPLDRVNSGSHYSMRNRATIVTRVYAEGLVGECYNGDTDDEQAAVVKIITDEIAPLLVGQDARDARAGGSACCLRPSTSSATAVLALRDGRCRQRAMGPRREGRRSAPLARVGRVADRCR